MLACVAKAHHVSALAPVGRPAAPSGCLHVSAQPPLAGLARRQGRGRCSAPVPAAAGAAAPAQEDHGLQWAVEVTRQTLTMPQVMQHLEQLRRIEQAAAHRGSAGSTAMAAAMRNQLSWVEHSTSTAEPPLVDGMLSDSDEDPELLEALAALPPHMLSEAQQAAIILQAWESAAHTKPENFDSDASLTVPGLADVAVVSRGGWQRHSWKKVNQDSFLALPLAAGSAACQECSGCGSTHPSAASAAVALGVFDGHGRAGQAASSHLRNALASGLLMHSQLALMSQPACFKRTAAAATEHSQQEECGRSQQQCGGAAAGIGAPGLAAEQAPDASDEAAQLLERCFAAAASTMPSTGADFSLSGSTAVLCLVQPGSVTAAWAGDSRAVLGVHKGGRYIACALTNDHKPGSPLERARIESTGGWVMQSMVDGMGQPAGPHRVYLRDSHLPGLAVSRCFGDYVATGAGVTSTPDVTTLVLPISRPTPAHSQGGRQDNRGRGNGGQRSRSNGRRGGTMRKQAGAPGQAQGQGRGQQQQQQPPRGRTQGPNGASKAARAQAQAHHVLIVASDGLWEFVSNSEAVRIASRCGTAQEAAECLALEAQAQWAVNFGGAHCDDITVAVAFLPASA